MPLPLNDPRIRLAKTAFVVYSHVNLAKACQFLLDFGLKPAGERRDGDVAFFKGYGVEPFCYMAKQSTSGRNEFGGAAYLVESRDELLKASKIAGASLISPLDAPGGGEIVTLEDPVGHKVHLIWGQKEKALEAMDLQILTINYESEKPRKGRFHRLKTGAAPVHRWGHYGVTYPDGQYQSMFDWYSTHLALAPSDIVYHEEKPLTCFFHVDRGDDYTDHHAFFFKRAKPNQELNVAHAAFEVHDFDTQQLGHDYLASKGYELCWGVGRHVLGSQVFDYWFDTSQFIVEHYADGDLVNQNTSVSHVQAGPEALSVWGPKVPAVF